MEIAQNNIVIIALTFLIYFCAKQFQNRTGWILLNPILVTILVLIGYLKITGIDFATYQRQSSMIEFWLKPAVVALGVPLYTQLRTIRRQLLPIVMSQLAGCIAGLVSVVLVAKWLGATEEVVVSLAPKSITSPIAMEVSLSLGGIPSLTAAIVICVGLLGAIFGFRVLELGRVKSSIGQALSMGTASHAVGTSRACEYGHIYGAYAGLGLIFNGLLTALLAPLVLAWIA